MAITYPTTLDDFTNPASGDTLSAVPHATQHADANDALEALEAKVGVNSSAVTTTLDYATKTGWIPMGVTLTYGSVDDPTGVVTSSADISATLTVGMRIKFTNGGNVIYGIVTVISGTTITFLHEIDPTDSLALNLMANSAITLPFYSPWKVPSGFPATLQKWTTYVAKDTTSTQASPSAGAYYNLGSFSLSIPIGAWRVQYICGVGSNAASGTSISSFTTLSTAVDSESDVDFTNFRQLEGPSGALRLNVMSEKEKFLTLASKTVYYFNVKVSGGLDSIYIYGASAKSFIRAICAYF